jgi:tripeptide aminopeptidase
MEDLMDFPDLLNSFLRYAKIDTQSSEESKSFPSTKKQLDLANLLKKELDKMKLDNVKVNKWGYVFAALKTNQTKKTPTIALIAHLDTSPDVSGQGVKPRIHKNYQGNDVVLSSKDNIVLKVKENPYLKKQIGKTLITTDGSTLLGADNKAGIAEIMSAVQYLIKHPEIPRPNIQLLFTPDEEVGRGTEKLNLKDVKADYAYTVDGEKLGEIEDETFCADTVVITVTGVNVHPGYAKNKLINSIKVTSEILELFPKTSMSPETTHKREGYVHPYTISGGVEQTTVKVLIRDFQEEGLKEKESHLKRSVDSIAKKYPKASVEFKIIESYRNMKIILDKYPEVLEKAIEAIKHVKIRPVKNIIRGGTDGARLSFMGLPTPNLFTGGLNFHSRYEWITLEDMQKATAVIIELMKLWSE